MTITIEPFLYIYLVFLAIWAIFFLVALYHMLRYSFKTVTSVGIMLFFLIVGLFLLLFSFSFISQIDWTLEFNIFGDVFKNSLQF